MPEIKGAFIRLVRRTPKGRQNRGMTGDGRFAAAMTAITRVLPFGLARFIAPSDVGYAIISLGTFLLNLLLLAFFHGTLRMALALALTLAYVIAGVVNYGLNRVLAFQSHGAVGKQFGMFVAVEVANYFLLVLGLTELLAAAGVYYELARTIAACGEAIFLYCGMRWLVFRDTLGARENIAENTEAEVEFTSGVGSRDMGTGA